MSIPKVSGKLQDISPLILGGATFNTQYNDDPYSMKIEDLLYAAFQNNINAIDTSPYYGPSEQLIGDALQNLHKRGKIARDNYYLCTKVGRIQLDDFDYSPDWITKSVHRSLERFNTTYLDVVYLHDIEFVEERGIFAALERLMELKSQGFIRNVGISGYPVPFLYHICSTSASHPKIGKLDLVLSYSNMCLQNTSLLDWYDKFMATGIQLLNNASILSMSLLRSQETRSFHPASQELKDACAGLATTLKQTYNTELAELATRFAIREWLPKNGKTVIGVSNIDELNSALSQYKTILEKSKDSQDKELIELSQKQLGPHFNETWNSGIYRSL
ncbi:hypothetical protein OGAPHI_007396 [Ogataea philodendri]|uniref:NADP-dependent oxidoreductase domain-containing protein n=1 Tax=Ogataea philodendri TaxID=1378263 RepID=A0A9P8NVX3_9ASCO|nr:uncharacterized protein OGAPHI_007396 [Ogataea philodendri]KAH3660191.1 hypothetical protein OGAPHI_007396 [Ogataea philodendri]